MSARSRLPVLAVVVVLGAIATWWTVLERRKPRAGQVAAAAAVPLPDAMPADASDAVTPDAFDVRGEIIDLPAGVKFIVPPRMSHAWVNDGKRTLAFGDGEQLVAIVNVTTGRRLKGLVSPRAGVKIMAKDEKLEVTSIEEYTPGRIRAQLDGVLDGVQQQQHLIFISLPTARVTIYVRLSGAIILDPRLGDLLHELRADRVVLPE